MLPEDTDFVLLDLAAPENVSLDALDEFAGRYADAVVFSVPELGAQVVGCAILGTRTVSSLRTARGGGSTR